MKFYRARWFFIAAWLSLNEVFAFSIVEFQRAPVSAFLLTSACFSRLRFDSEHVGQAVVVDWLENVKEN